MSKINSVMPLTLSAVTVRDGGANLDSSDADYLLRKMLAESTLIQQAALAGNQTIDCSARNKFSSATARELVLTISPTIDRLQKFNVRAMDKYEVYRLLSAWQQRLRIAEYLKSTNWTATYAECEIALGRFSYQWYRNIKLAQQLPALPKIKTARIPLAKSALQFCWHVELRGQRLTLPKITLWDRVVDLHFEIPAGMQRLHPNPTKITRPTIFLKKEVVTFDFTFEEDLVREEINSKSVLAADIGKSKIFSAARVYSDGRYSEEFVPSIFTDRQTKRLKIHSREISRISSKNKRRKELGIIKRNAIAHEKALREKRTRTWDGAEWSAAADLRAHLNPGEVLVMEKLNFNTGASQFRSGIIAKIEHSANRTSRNLKKVNPSYSSQTCPQCQARTAPDPDRKLRCFVCGWIADRDFSAAIVLGQRGLKIKKLSRRKNCATPKRPRNSIRKRVKPIIENTVRSAFTGAVSTEATDSLTVATSVIREICSRVNRSVILKT